MFLVIIICLYIIAIIKDKVRKIQMLKNISNFVSNSLNEYNYHNLKTGDNMIKNYGNKIVKFEFNFNENGEDLQTIINKTYKDELYRKKILL